MNSVTRVYTKCGPEIPADAPEGGCSACLLEGGLRLLHEEAVVPHAGDDAVEVSPAYIGQSGYGVILVQTLPDPRASGIRQAYSVVVTLEPGPGYAVGEPSSAQMMIKP